MLRYFFAFVLFMHGIIHFMGFSKAFGYGKFTQLSLEISKTAGVFWIITALLFIGSTIFFLMKVQWWWMVAIIAITLSQVLIFTDWQDAKYGTIANAIILLAVVMSFGEWNFSRSYRADVQQELKRTRTLQPELLTEEDIVILPVLIQNYLRYVGVVDQPKVHNMKVVFEGEMRQKGKDWFHFTSDQFNFFDVFTRLFFMEANMYGMKVPGYHRYKDGKGTMDIRLFGLVPVNKTKGAELNQAETVTMFNDMCLLAPATLIDKRIQWQPVDNSSVKATFTVNEITISAILHFNSKGQLVNFVSDDRYILPGGMRYRFSTPVRAYKNINGYNLNSEGEAVWQYPEGEFTYGKIRIIDVQYNKGLVEMKGTPVHDADNLVDEALSSPQ
jgi:hypothetical protein